MLVFFSVLITLHWSDFAVEHRLLQSTAWKETVIKKGVISWDRCGCLCPLQWCNAGSKLIALQGNTVCCWCDRRSGLFRDGVVQAASLVLLQQQPSTGMQGAYWRISRCLLHYYLYSRYVPISLPFFDPAAMKWCQRGTQLVIKNLLPSFAFPAFTFPAKGAFLLLVKWCN